MENDNSLHLDMLMNSKKILCKDRQMDNIDKYKNFSIFIDKIVRHKGNMVSDEDTFLEAVTKLVEEYVNSYW